MRVIRNLQELERPPHGSAVTIGNFDGVHLAHQQLLRRVVECARPEGASSIAVTFDPHPTRVLAPERAPTLLTSLSRKVRLIETTGIDLLIVLPFTTDMARLSPQTFVQSILADGLNARSVHVGPNFRFGHKQAGTTQVLDELARGAGFKVEILPLLRLRGERVSSSRIRKLIAEGHVEKAGRLLGRPHSVCGGIEGGGGIGKRQTVPTLNLEPVEELLPGKGVYITRTRIGQELHESVSNVGTKPTFGDHRVTVESHLLNFQGEVESSEMEVEFVHRLREEKKFPDSASLLKQIRKDASRANQFFRLLKKYRSRRDSRVTAESESCPG